MGFVRSQLAITAGKSSRDKEMFSQVSAVDGSVFQHAFRHVCISEHQTGQGGVWTGGGWTGGCTPPKMATEAGGKHPTGMYTCLVLGLRCK